jgi:alcohol dehydrogenase class IV
MEPLRPFALRLPAATRFGRGASLAAAPEIATLGPRLLLVHGRSVARAAPLGAALEAEGCVLASLPCPEEPTLDMLRAALTEARAFAPAAVVACGGGAPLDLGKALAALLPGPETDPLAHLEGVGEGRPLQAPPLPFVAIPTTAGTGSECTKNAVIGVPERKRKVSLRDDRMVPVLAIVDPALTDGTPLAQTLASGLDALTQVIEPYLSRNANPFTDALCLPAIPEAAAALETLLREGESAPARDRLAYVAHASGIALANAGLGAVHGLAGVIGGVTGEPHGAICGRLLPHVLRAHAASERLNSEGRERLALVERMLERGMPDGVDRIRDLAGRHLREAGGKALAPEERARIADLSRSASSMKHSSVEFSALELTEILKNAGW